MKRLRISTLVSATVGLLALAVYWSSRPAGFTTPAACLDAYREAAQAGNVEAYLSCFAEPLRTEIQRQHPDRQKLTEWLRRQMKDVKTWVQLPASGGEGSMVLVNVDQVRISGNRRLLFRLQRLQNGWFIVDMDSPKLIPAGIPYGTHVSKVPEEASETPQP